MSIRPTYPGIYVEEIPSGVRPITGVSTADTAFVDFFQRGPVDEATRITSFQDFKRTFGGLDIRSEASYAIQQFYLNGGQIAWVVRVKFPTMSEARALLKGNGGTLDVCRIKAASDGTWARDNVRVAIDHKVPSNKNFNMVVSEVTSRNGNQRVLSSESYRNLSADPKDARFAPNLVNPVSQLVQLEWLQPRPTVISTKTSHTFTLGTSRTLVANFTPAIRSDATLSDLKVGVITVSGFAPGTVTYNIQLPSGTNPGAPAARVTVTANNPDAEVNITQAAALPGAATVVVTAPERTTKTYTVNLTVAEASSDTTLRDLKVGGTTVRGFDPGILTYTVQLPGGTNPGAPEAKVTATANANNDAEVNITQAAGLPGSAKVVVTALDRTTKTYTVNLTVCTVTHTVSFSANPPAGGTPSGGGTYAEGASVTVTATAKSGYSFVKWTEVVRPDPTAVCDNIDIINAPDDSYFSVKLAGGSDGDVLNATTGSIEPEREQAFADALTPLDQQKGMYALSRIAPFIFNILCIPATAKFSQSVNLRRVVSEATKYCETKRVFFIMDILSNDGLKDFNYITTNQSFKDNLDLLRHQNAAFYFPQLQIPDSLNGGIRIVGASGTMAGIYAKTDATRGVWKAPAGTEAKLVNASIDNSVKLTDLENGVLNQIGINVIRNFPIYSNVGWGARTLKGSDLEAGEWKYIPVRRTALFIEESLYQGLKWAVFEPNDEPLWAQIRLNVGAFMHNLFRQGAFQGQTRNEAYFVKCDKETTTQNDIDQGIVNVVVGFAPLKPAEFVIIQLQQMAGQVQV